MQVSQNTMDTHHGHRLLDGCSAQTASSSGCNDETVTKKTFVVLTNSLPQEMLHRGALISDMWRLSTCGHCKFTNNYDRGAGCSNQMQVSQGQVLVRVCALVQAASGWCILLLLVPTIVLTLCDLRWWRFFQSSTSTNT